MDHPPRTLMATTGTAISITKTAEDGRRMHRGIRREAAEEKIRRSPPGDEEEPEEHRHHHLEEMEILKRQLLSGQLDHPDPVAKPKLRRAPAKLRNFFDF